MTAMLPQVNVARHMVTFDGGCGFCTTAMRWLTRLDWLGRFELVPNAAAAGLCARHEITPSALDEAMHCVAANGVVHRGAGAVRFIALRLPLTCLPALLLYLPGAMKVMIRAYAWLARRRHVLFQKS